MAEKPKKYNIAFNGFGRIGRNLVRKLIKDDRYNIVAINAKTTVDVRAHLFKYDSVHGKYQGEVNYELNDFNGTLNYFNPNISIVLADLGSDTTFDGLDPTDTEAYDDFVNDNDEYLN